MSEIYLESEKMDDFSSFPKEPRLIDDVIFREAIEEGKEPLLKAIIEPILGYPINIKGFTTQPQLKNAEQGYQPILDCMVELDPSGVIDLEAQRQKHENFGKRIALYHSALRHLHSEKGALGYSFEPAIGIWICEFDLFEKGKGLYCIKRYSKEADFMELEGDDPIYVFNCLAKSFETETLRQLAHDMLCKKPKDIGGKILGDTLSLIRERKMKEAEEKHMETYDVAFERGEKSGIAKGEKIGEKRGIVKGEKIGIVKGEKIAQEKYERKRDEAIVDWAKRGTPIETIASVYKLSKEEVLAIINKPSSGGQ